MQSNRNAHTHTQTQTQPRHAWQNACNIYIYKHEIDKHFWCQKYVQFLDSFFIFPSNKTIPKTLYACTLCDYCVAWCACCLCIECPGIGSIDIWHQMKQNAKQLAPSNQNKWIAVCLGRLHRCRVPPNTERPDSTDMEQIIIYPDCWKFVHRYAVSRIDGTDQNYITNTNAHTHSIWYGQCRSYITSNFTWIVCVRALVGHRCYIPAILENQPMQATF